MPPRAAAASSRHLGVLSVSERVGAYAELSKFGIVLLVLVSAGAGFMLRAPLGPEFPWAQGLLMLAGVMLLSCGASAPECLGTCPIRRICEPDGKGGCHCVLINEGE